MRWEVFEEFEQKSDISDSFMFQHIPGFSTHILLPFYLHSLRIGAKGTRRAVMQERVAGPRQHSRSDKMRGEILGIF